MTDARSASRAPKRNIIDRYARRTLQPIFDE
jgi:hypothetical protein